LPSDVRGPVLLVALRLFAAIQLYPSAVFAFKSAVAFACSLASRIAMRFPVWR
jgi:hypothetical protein